MDVGVFDGVASGHHHAVSEVDAAMAHSGGVISAGEKHQVSGLGFGFADVLALVPQAIGGGASDVITSLIVDPADIAGAVETGFRSRTTPDVRCTDVLLRLLIKKKAANLFQTYCFRWPPMGGGYSVLKVQVRLAR